MKPEHKIRENRLRREAVSLGFAFIKTHRRNPITKARINYWLIDWNTQKANTFEGLDEIADFLGKEASQ